MPALRHVALRVSDLARAETFYAGLLGLRVVRRHADDAGLPRATWLRAGDVVLMLELQLRGEGPTEGSAHVLGFDVDSLAPWEKTLAEAGVAVVDRTPFTLFVRDPDGHRVGLSTYPFPELEA